MKPDETKILTFSRNKEEEEIPPFPVWLERMRERVDQEDVRSIATILLGEDTAEFFVIGEIGNTLELLGALERLKALILMENFSIEPPP